MKLVSGLRPVVAVVTALLGLTALACGRTSQPAATASAGDRRIVILTGPAGGAYSPLGQALADVYNTRIPGLHVVAAAADGPGGAAANARALDEGKADLAFSRADLAFQVFRTQSSLPAGAAGAGAHLRSIAVLYTNAVHILVRRASGIVRGSEIRGRRVQMSDDNAGSILTRAVLEGHGLTTDDIRSIASSRNALSRLKNDELDVRIFASAYPLAGIDDVGETSPIRLLSLEPAAIDRLRSRFPFFKPAVIPKGTYRGQVDDVQTVGIDGLLLCHDAMPESVVYDLTQTLFGALPELTRLQPSAGLINVVKAPATPVPLHPGAARYYRERDLFR